jgi:hypothetical protein
VNGAVTPKAPEARSIARRRKPPPRAPNTALSAAAEGTVTEHVCVLVVAVRGLAALTKVASHPESGRVTDVPSRTITIVEFVVNERNHVCVMVRDNDTTSPDTRPRSNGVDGFTRTTGISTADRDTERAPLDGRDKDAADGGRVVIDPDSM